MESRRIVHVYFNKTVVISGHEMPSTKIGEDGTNLVFLLNKLAIFSGFNHKNEASICWQIQ